MLQPIQHLTPFCYSPVYSCCTLRVTNTSRLTSGCRRFWRRMPCGCPWMRQGTKAPGSTFSHSGSWGVKETMWVFKGSIYCSSKTKILHSFDLHTWMFFVANLEKKKTNRVWPAWVPNFFKAQLKPQKHSPPPSSDAVTSLTGCCYLLPSPFRVLGFQHLDWLVGEWHHPAHVHWSPLSWHSRSVPGMQSELCMCN